VRFFARRGLTVQQVTSDNGSCYVSATHALAYRLLGLRHLRTRPYRPRTNGKAGRFIRTMLGGWAYGAISAPSAERIAALDGWLWTYQPSPPTRLRSPQAARSPPTRAEQPAWPLQLERHHLRDP
jgi:transposase InsO family protein